MTSNRTNYARFEKKDDAYYTQYSPSDVIKHNIYDINMECDADLRYQKKITLMVDSRDRRSNEEPNKYSLKLKKEYMDVINIELLRANIPNSNYIINDYNNKFYFQDSEDQLEPTCGRPYHIIQLPKGNYPISHESDDSITSLLEAGMNAVDPANQYKILVDKNQKRVTITQISGSGIFNILFQYPQCQRRKIKHDDITNETDNDKNDPLPHNMALVLGFKPTSNKTKHTTYIGEYMYSILPSKYIILRINHSDKQWARMDSNHDPCQNSFAVLSLDDKFDNFSSTNNCDFDDEKFILTFNPPLRRMDRLDIEFLDPLGNPYDFHGKDHYMVFEITSLSRVSDYHQGSNKVNKVMTK